MKSVTLTIRWPELFGETKKDMSEKVRRKRWEQWKKLCAEQPDGKEVIEQWTNCEEGCSGCMHRDGDWCNLESLPCTVNPILTYQYNMLGLACMGLGYQAKQMEMF